MKRKIFALLATMLALVGGAFADGLIIIHNPPPRPIPPQPLPPWQRPHYVFAPLQVVFHKVDVDIKGQTATTRVEQEFFNPNQAVLEGEYIFPIPKGAHLDKFSMKIGDKDMEAELLDAAKARSIYEDIVRRQKDPALLEYTGRPAFRVRIFPIEPHSRKKVSLAYTELLRVDNGLASYVYPLNTEKFSAEPLKTASIKVHVDASSPIKALYSPSHSVDVRHDGDRRATIGWEASNSRPDTDFQLLYSTAETEVGLSVVTHKKSGEDGWFMLLASPGADMAKSKDTNPKDVVFVLDTSGSMAEKGKLEQAKKALNFCIENLNDTDRFEIVRFSTEAETVLEKLSEANRANRDRALDAVRSFKPIGGTAIADALESALKLKPADNSRPFLVVFLTDGKPTIGETDEDRIVARVAREQGAMTRIFSFGIGTDINTHLLDKITERTKAASQFVLPEEDLEVKVSNFFTKIKEPLLTNLKLEFPAGVRVSKLYPNPLPDLFRGDQLVLVGRYSGDGEGDVSLEGTLNGVPKRMTQRLKFGAESGNDFIGQLWATRRVGWLLDEIRLRGENKELRDEVVDLARRFAIVTPYTSYLIVEDEARRGIPIAAQSFQQLTGDAVGRRELAEGWANLRKKDGYDGAFNARASNAYKYANQAGVSQDLAKSESKSAIATGATAAAPAAKPSETRYADRVKRLDQLEQNARVVNGKAFAQNGTSWTDTELQSRQNVARKRVQFGSKDYFELLEKEPDSAQWLALGNNVTFALRDQVFEVYE